MKLFLLRDSLAKHQHRLVLAESCTAGLAAAILGQIPGISQWLCGSMVVYRNNSKSAWLGIDSAILDDPLIGPVSELVTSQLARAVLLKTPEATIAAAITGHLGPNAPSGLDGLVFVCIAQRIADSIATTSESSRLQSPAPKHDQDVERRLTRQREAAEFLLQHLLDTMESR